VDFADHDKRATLVESAKERIGAMAKEMAIDFALHQGVYAVSESVLAQLEDLKAAGITTIKIFTTYKDAGYLIEMRGLRELFATCKRLEPYGKCSLRG
jgi:dihydropyrimidinase